MTSLPIPSLPWQIVSQDIFNHEGKSYLVTVCHFSDWIEINELTNTLSTTIIAKTKTHFARHGVPAQCHTDKGPQFISLEYENFASSYGFCHSTSSPYHSQGNGRAEAAVKVCKTMLKKSDDLDAGLLNYRNTPPRGHSYSPAQRLFNRRTRTTIPTSDAALVPEVVSRDTVHQEILNKRASAKLQYDKDCKGQHLPLTAGDYVYMKPPPAKRGQPWTYGRVSGSPAPRSYVIETPTGYMRRNRTQIQSAQPPTFYHATPPKPHTTLPKPPLTPKPLIPHSTVMSEPDVRMHSEVAPPRNDYHPELESPRKEPPRPAEPPRDTESRSLNSPIRRTRTRIIKNPERYTDSIYKK